MRRFRPNLMPFSAGGPIYIIEDELSLASALSVSMVLEPPFAPPTPEFDNTTVCATPAMATEYQATATWWDPVGSTGWTVYFIFNDGFAPVFIDMGAAQPGQARTTGGMVMPGPGSFPGWLQYSKTPDTMTGGSDTAVIPACQDTPPPGAFSASLSVSGTTATLTWGSSDGAVEYSPSIAGVGPGWVPAGNPRTYTRDVGLEDYLVTAQVIARNSGGTYTATAAPKPTRPQEPPNVSASAAGNDGVDVSWGTGLTPGNQYANGHAVRVSKSSGPGGPYDATVNVDGIATGHSRSGLPSETIFDVFVSAYNAAGSSSAGYAAFATPVIVPGAPSMSSRLAACVVTLEVSDTTDNPNWTGVLWRYPQGSAFGVQVGSWTPSGGYREFSDTPGDGDWTYQAWYQRSGYSDSPKSGASTSLAGCGFGGT